MLLPRLSGTRARLSPIPETSCPLSRGRSMMKLMMGKPGGDYTAPPGTDAGDPIEGEEDSDLGSRNPAPTPADIPNRD